MVLVDDGASWLIFLLSIIFFVNYRLLNYDYNLNLLCSIYFSELFGEGLSIKCPLLNEIKIQVPIRSKPTSPGLPYQ